MENKSLITALRWVAVLPTSILGSILAYLIGGLYMYINSGGYSWYTGSNVTGIVEISLFALQNGFTGAAFVATGWYVAPNYKKVVRIVLATVVSCICILSIPLSIIFNVDEWHMYLSVIATTVGAIYVAYNLDLAENT